MYKLMGIIAFLRSRAGKVAILGTEACLSIHTSSGVFLFEKRLSFPSQEPDKMAEKHPFEQ